jgi:hypothetical protein
MSVELEALEAEIELRKMAGIGGVPELTMKQTQVMRMTRLISQWELNHMYKHINEPRLVRRAILASQLRVLRSHDMHEQAKRFVASLDWVGTYPLK